MSARTALARTLRYVTDRLFTETRWRASHGADEPDHALLDTLPVDMQFLIMTYLSPQDLCRLGGTSRYWRSLVQDPLLWRYFLMRDMPCWKSVDHLSMPSTEVISAAMLDGPELPRLDFMGEYLRGCSACRHQWQKPRPAYEAVTSFLQSLVGETEPRFAMFGPGLEQLEVSLMTTMMLSPHVLPVSGIPQRQINSIGSGITFTHKHQHKFNIITLYSTNSTERERARVEGTSTRSKLFVQQGEVESGRPSYSVAPQVQEVCQAVNGFIFVVNAEAECAGVREEDCAQIQAMLQPAWGPPSRPLLVLSCVSREGQESRTACVNIAQQLQLTLLPNPWMVQDTVAESLAGLLDGVDWLLRNCGLRL